MFLHVCEKCGTHTFERKVDVMVATWPDGTASAFGKRRWCKACQIENQKDLISSHFPELYDRYGNKAKLKK